MKKILFILLFIPLIVEAQIIDLSPADTIYWYNTDNHGVIEMNIDKRYNQYPYVVSATLSGSSNPDSTISVIDSIYDRDGDATSASYRWGTSPDSLGTITWLPGRVSDTFNISSDLSGLFPVMEVTPLATTGGRRGLPVTVWGDVMGLWILETGAWNDNGIWKWNATWNDN